MHIKMPLKKRSIIYHAEDPGDPAYVYKHCIKPKTTSELWQGVLIMVSRENEDPQLFWLFKSYAIINSLLLIGIRQTLPVTGYFEQ